MATVNLRERQGIGMMVAAGGRVRHALRIGLAVFAVTQAAATEVLAKPVRWSGNGHLYDVRHVPEGLSWVQALLRAQALGCGWYLATITSAAENAFVFGLASRKPEVFGVGGFGPWLGAFQKNALDEPAGSWRWVTDEPFTYTKWLAGEPSDTNGVEAFMNSRKSATWNDAGPLRLMPSFIAEFDAARQRQCRAMG